MLMLAKEYDSPLALRSSDLEELGAMSKKASSAGVEAVLDPSTGYGQGLCRSLDRYAMLRKAAVNGVKGYGHPLMASTLDMREKGERQDESSCTFNESSLASMLMDRFASVILMHSVEPWAILPVLTLRDGLYSDPSVEPKVEPKLYSIGGAGKDSPVLLTTNFALTYHSVSKDLEDAKIPAHLLVVDTEGLAVSVAVAADRLTPELIKEALDNGKVHEKISHRTLILPGVAGQLKDKVEESTGWKVIVGPQDSSQLTTFLKENWKNKA